MNFKEKVGVNQSNPQADLHVGNTAIIGKSSSGLVGGIPLIWQDNFGAFVVTGLETGYDADGNVTITAGVAYNKVRVQTAFTTTLRPTNTGAAHTEYSFINCDGSIALTQDYASELTPRVFLATIDVDASGNATATYDGRDRNLYIGDEIAGWKKLSEVGGPNSVAASGLTNIAASDSYIPVKGWWNFSWDNTYIVFQIYASGGWRGGRYQAQGSFWCDGANMRLYNNDSGNTESFFYQQLG